MFFDCYQTDNVPNYYKEYLVTVFYLLLWLEYLIKFIILCLGGKCYVICR